MYDASATSMIKKVRALCEDLEQSSLEMFTYSTSNIFTLAEPHISTIDTVLVNSQALQSGEAATFDASTNKITISGVDFSSGDYIEVNYAFTKYSDSEVLEYIRAALVWMSIYDYSTETYTLRSDGIIIPSPHPKTIDLVCIIASILIKPNYIHYRMPNLAVNYPSRMTQEEKIAAIINRFKHGVGVVEIIQWNRSPGL